MAGTWPSTTRAGPLAGVYDFADSGLGALHQEFIYSNFIVAEWAGR